MNSNKIIAVSNNNNQTFFDRLNYCLHSPQIPTTTFFEDQNKISLDLYINNTDLSLKIAELIKKDLKNVDLNIKRYNWTQYLNKLQQGNFNNQIFIMSYNYQNKFEFIFDNFYSGSEKNYSNYQNSRLDNLIEYIQLIDNQDSKKRAYQIIEEILLKESPFLISIQGGDSFLISDKLSGRDSFSNIYLDNNFEKLFFK